MATRFRGLSFPFRRGPRGFPQPVEDEDLLWESIQQLILTGQGERVMRPDVGSLVMRLIFEANNELLAELLVADISQTLGRYEPRVLLTDIVPTRDEEEGSVTLDITYVDRANGREMMRALNFPFPQV